MKDENAKLLDATAPALRQVLEARAGNVATINLERVIDAARAAGPIGWKPVMVGDQRVGMMAPTWSVAFTYPRPPEPAAPKVGGMTAEETNDLVRKYGVTIDADGKATGLKSDELESISYGLGGAWPADDPAIEAGVITADRIKSEPAERHAVVVAGEAGRQFLRDALLRGDILALETTVDAPRPAPTLATHIAPEDVAIVTEVLDFLEDEADNRSCAGSDMSDYAREPKDLAERLEALLPARSSATDLTPLDGIKVAPALLQDPGALAEFLISATRKRDEDPFVLKGGVIYARNVKVDTIRPGDSPEDVTRRIILGSQELAVGPGAPRK